jgi:hypothetical protein
VGDNSQHTTIFAFQTLDTQDQSGRTRLTQVTTRTPISSTPTLLGEDKRQKQRQKTVDQRQKTKGKDKR